MTQALDLTPPGAPMSLPTLLAAKAQRQADQLALIGIGRQPMNYRDLWAHVDHVARTLRALGVQRTDRVAMVLPNGPEMASAFLAVASIAVAAPLNPDFSAREFDFFLRDLSAKALLVDASLDSTAVAVARELGMLVIVLDPVLSAPAGSFSLNNSTCVDVAPIDVSTADDVALLLHTSGTTSRPKLVPLTHRNICCSSYHIATQLSIRPNDRCLNVMPLFHVHGLIGCLCASLYAGASVVCTPDFIAPQFLKWLASFNATWYSAVPSIHQAVLRRCQQREEITHTLRFIRASSAMLPARVRDGLEEIFGVPVIDAYGMTEASHQMASNPLPPRIRKPGSVGLAAGPEIAVMNDVGNHLDRNEIGEIVIRGPNVTTGYLGGAGVNDSVFVDGWLRTGDLGYLDSDGYRDLPYWAVEGGDQPRWREDLAARGG